MTDEVFRGEAVHVMGELCSTCVFRPGNLMELAPGGLRGMVDDCLDHDGVIPCHTSVWEAGPPAICRGFFDRHAHDIFPLRLALAFDAIVFDA